NVGGGCADRSFFPGILVNKKEFSIEIKNKAAAVVQRPFEHRLATCLQPRIQVTGDIGEREIRRGFRDAYDHAQPGWNHRRGQSNGREFLASFENAVERYD